MFTERTSVGLDVHARSVAAAAIDGGTGELVQARLTPSPGHIRSWLEGLPGPVAVAYEAGPTGFELYRVLTAAGIRCEVAAPSKLQRPAGDRVKTDAKDALHLARLLRMDEITAVAVPTIDQEASRDLVRARENCRGDLMRARHRLSKLLLRHGIVYYGGDAWTSKHDVWLRREALPQLTSHATRLTFDSGYETVLAAKGRRERLDAAIEQMAADGEFTPVVRRLGCLRGVSTADVPDRVRLGRRDRRLAPVHRQHHWLLRRARAERALLWCLTESGTDHQDRQRPRTAVACRGRLAPPPPLPGRQDHARPVGPGPRGRPGSRRRGQPSTPPAVARVQRAA